MNTRRLTKKYKHKSRSKKSKRRGRTRRRGRSGRSGRSGRRVLKGGMPSARPTSVVVRRRSGASARPIKGFVVRRTSGASSFRPSSSAGISKKNFNFECFYKKLMNTPVGQLPSTIQDSRKMYIQATTLQNVKPKDSYPNMTGLKFVNYLRGIYNSVDEVKKQKIRSIVSLFDQCNMSQGARFGDLAIIKGQVDGRYYACYEKLYNQVYKNLFPNGNSDCYPVAIPATVFDKLPIIKEVKEERMSDDDVDGDE